MDEITIGARLRTLRRWRGMRQVDLGGLAGLSTSYVPMVETGQRPLDRRSHIAAIASALRVSETDLVSGPHLTPGPAARLPGHMTSREDRKGGRPKDRHVHEQRGTTEK
jgi:transcriptional regulator with XRE-family HTH domain